MSPRGRCLGTHLRARRRRVKPLIRLAQLSASSSRALVLDRRRRRTESLREIGVAIRRGVGLPGREHCAGDRPHGEQCQVPDRLAAPSADPGMGQDVTRSRELW